MRIGIFCFFDPDGKADGYVEYLLRELKRVVDELYIVVNGKIDANGRDIFIRYAEKIFLRENSGFDAGAYKDAVFNFIGVSKIREFDELVLCNDTFFGPFISFEEIFEKMDTKEADFWGLKYIDNSFLSLLESYFLVFRKKILIEDVFFDYFKEKIIMDTDDVSYAHANFERGLFYELVHKGYSFSTFANSINCNDNRSGNYALKEEGLPILKKKVFSKEDYIENNAFDAINWIRENYEYDIELIRECVNRKYEIEWNEKSIVEDTHLYQLAKMKVTESDIVSFANRVQKLYIYGAGIYATSIYHFLGNQLANLIGFVVSDNKKKTNMDFKENLPIYGVSEVVFDEHTGIIVALNYDGSTEVKRNIQGVDKVLYLWDGM